MKFQEALTGLIAMVILLLIIGVVLKVVIEAFGLIVLLIVLWYVYTHILQKAGKRK